MKILLKNATQIKLKNRKLTVISNNDGTYMVEVIRLKETKETELIAMSFELKGKVTIAQMRLTESGAFSLLEALQSELVRNHNI